MGFRLSGNETRIHRPLTETSGGSGEGGDITTFSTALSTLTFSSKSISIRRGDVPVFPIAGDNERIRGGVSSKGPPSGPLPGFAQAPISTIMSIAVSILYMEYTLFIAQKYLSIWNIKPEPILPL